MKLGEEVLDPEPNDGDPMLEPTCGFCGAPGHACCANCRDAVEGEVFSSCWDTD